MQYQLGSAIPRFIRETPPIHENHPLVYPAFFEDMTNSSISFSSWGSRTRNNRWLLSFEQLRKLRRGSRRARFYTDAISDPQARVICDSGAHVWQQRMVHDDERDLHLTKLAAFLRENGHRFDHFANFDYVHFNPQSCYDAQKNLERLGVWPFPVHHAGDCDIKWFRKYLDEGYTFIGIARPNRKSQTRHAFDRIFNIADKYKVFLHGFAVTAQDLMNRYPFYSVDSTSPFQASIRGAVNVIRDGRLTEIDVASTNRADWDCAKEQVEAHGFEFETMSYEGGNQVAREKARVERAMWNCFVYTHLPELLARPTGRRKSIC